MVSCISVVSMNTMCIHDGDFYRLRNFYEISKDFPENVLLIRSATQKKRTIYFVSTGLAALLKNVDQDEFNVRGFPSFSNIMVSDISTKVHFHCC